MKSPTIAMDKLSKDYRSGFWMTRHRALHELSLTVEQGESFGFVGPNGAGKTTTIKILAGLHEATSGTATILGKPVQDPKSRQELGFLPERPYFYVHLTAREVLHFYGQLFGLDIGTRNRRIEELLERVQMTHAADAPLKDYSKGMLQRIGLCQSLIHDPKLIILDEPMSGLDPLGRALVRDIIVDEQSKGKTIFFSSHVLSDVQSICSRVAILVGGRLRGVGTVNELIGEQVDWIDVHVDIDLEGAERLRSQAECRYNEGRQYHFRIEPELSDAFQAAVQAHQGRILEFSPKRKTLEAVLVSEMQSSNQEKSS